MRIDEDIKLSWERFLNPEFLKSNLIVASIYLAAFEILKECIIERPKEFFTTGFDQYGFIVGKEYTEKVLSLDKSPVYASLYWLKNLHAIEQEDIEKFTQVKRCRNQLAHELPNFLSEGMHSDPGANFQTIISVLSKIEKWWIYNVEIPTNPDFDDNEVNEEEIMPGRIITLQLLTDIALGDDENSNSYYTEFVNKYKNI